MTDLRYCGRCKGSGEITFNPSRNRDPQCEDYATCPDCLGDGTQVRADLELIADLAATPSDGPDAA